MTVEAAVEVRKPRPWRVFASGNFRNLWAITMLSLLGDFFSYIAMAWLVLQLTGSSLALGSVLVVGAIPRGVLMLVGGAVSDRLSPRATMVGSMALRAALVAPLAVLVLAGHVQMWEVYGISFVFGVVDAFFLPARGSILPKIVSDRELEPGNAVLNVTGMAAVIVGPAIAGVVVAAFGTGWAFAVDAAAFALGVPLVLLLPRAARAASSEEKGSGLGGQILAGFSYAWNDVGLRAALIIIAVVDFFANGALNVGLATLAHVRFGNSAAALGILLGAWGVGATLGAAVSGMVPPPKRFGLLVVGSCAWIGLGIGVVGVIPTLIPAAIVMAITGVATGLLNTYGVSWLQRRTDPAMQGRVMGLVMTASLGLAPVGFAISGAVAQIQPTLLFVVSGAIIVVAAVGAYVSRTVRAM
jgi:MFS family permease